MTTEERVNRFKALAADPRDPNGQCRHCGGSPFCGPLGGQCLKCGKDAYSLQERG